MIIARLKLQLFLLALAIAPLPSRAETGWKVLSSTRGVIHPIEGGNPIELRLNGKLLCIRSKNFVVVTKTYNSDFLVKKRESDDWDNSCKWNPDGSHMVIKQQFAEYFLGLWGNFFLLDSGVSHSRALLVYDLKERRMVHNSQYYDPILLRDGKISIWKGEIEATREECPKDYVSGQTVIQARYWFDLSKLREETTSERRCEYIE